MCSKHLKKTKKKKRILASIFGLVFIFMTGMEDYLFTSSFRNYQHPGPVQPLYWLVGQIESNNATILPTNPYVHGYKIHRNTCGAETSPNDLIILVKTSVQNFEARQVIRQTWGDMTRYRNFSTEIVFMVGWSSSDEIEEAVFEEHKQHGDILQGGFRENYYNLTIKVQMGLHWLHNHCNHFKYSVFIDDDVYLSPKNLLRYLINPNQYPLNSEIKQFNSITNVSTGLFAGYKASTINRIPIRFNFHKWYVTLKDYPYTFYPPFIIGGVHIMSRLTIQKLYYASLFTEYFR